MSDGSRVLWFGDAGSSAPDALEGRAVEARRVDTVEAALAATAEADATALVYAGPDPAGFFDGLRDRHPHVPVVLVADPADCGPALADPEADVVRVQEPAVPAVEARLGALLAARRGAAAPVETLVRYETILEAVGDGVYALDADYRYVLVNEALCEMTGYDRETLLGSDVSLVLTGDDLDTGVSARERARGDPGTVQQVELTLERAGGSTVPVENRFAAVAVDGTFAGTVGVVRDVTERRERERELRRKTESLEAFASVVGHDLRNPLSVADGYLDTLAADVDHPALDDVAAALSRMDDIVGDLLLLARGSEAVDTTAVDLAATAEAAWATVPTADATLAVATDGRVVASESHLRSLFENLFRNAVEHAGPSVRVEVGDLEAGFYVADDGPGFPADVRDDAFERGVSGDDGTGLGLAIVRSVADAHGWTVTVSGGDDGARVEVRGVEQPTF